MRSARKARKPLKTDPLLSGSEPMYKRNIVSVMTKVRVGFSRTGLS